MSYPVPWVRAIVLDSRDWVLCEGDCLPGGPAVGGLDWAGSVATYLGPAETPWELAGLYSRPSTQMYGDEHRMEVVLGRRSSQVLPGARPLHELCERDRLRVENWLAGTIPVE